MRTTIAALVAVVLVGGCAKRDTKADSDHEQVRMMERLLEAAQLDGLDAGAACAPDSRDR